MDLAVPTKDSRMVFGLSAVIEGLPPDTYNLGLCGYVSSFDDPADWNFNGESYTTAILITP